LKGRVKIIEQNLPQQIRLRKFTHGGDGGEPVGELFAVDVECSFYKVLQRDALREKKTIDQVYIDYLKSEDLEG